MKPMLELLNHANCEIAHAYLDEQGNLVGVDTWLPSCYGGRNGPLYGQRTSREVLVNIDVAHYRRCGADVEEVARVRELIRQAGLGAYLCD